MTENNHSGSISCEDFILNEPPLAITRVRHVFRACNSISAQVKDINGSFGASNGQDPHPVELKLYRIWYFTLWALFRIGVDALVTRYNTNERLEKDPDGYQQGLIYLMEVHAHIKKLGHIFPKVKVRAGRWQVGDSTSAQVLACFGTHICGLEVEFLSSGQGTAGDIKYMSAMVGFWQVAAYIADGNSAIILNEARHWEKLYNIEAYGVERGEALNNVLDHDQPVPALPARRLARKPTRTRKRPATLVPSPRLVSRFSDWGTSSGEDESVDPTGTSFGVVDEEDGEDGVVDDNRM